ncbi:MAG: ribosome silencing factor [Nitrospiria bacterium]
MSTKAKALLSARAALNKKAEDVVIYEVKKITFITDYFVVCTADSQPQLNAIAEEIEKQLGKKRFHPVGIEGENISHWILMDYGDVIIHLFREDSRKFYNLDGLWGDSPKIDLEETALHLKKVMLK